MRPTHLLRRRHLAAIAAVLLLAASVPLPAAAGSDPLGAELMRLTDLDRVALGQTALAIDPVLAAYAHDATFACPSNAGLVLSGRAVDMAQRGYFAHTIKDCLKPDAAEYSALDIMLVVFAYNTFRGENIAWNQGYSTTSLVTYETGCAMGQAAGCPGVPTTALQAVAVSQRAFMNSAGHRANILGGFDRYVVTAVSSVGESPRSNEVVATPIR